MPLATCPHCGNSADRTILINAHCSAVIEGDQFDYFDSYFKEATAHATCNKCGYSSSFHNFKLGLKPLDSQELETLQKFLVDVAHEYEGCHGNNLALRCLGLIRHHAADRTLAPAQAGEKPVTPAPQDYIQLAQRLYSSLCIDTEPYTVDITDDGLGAYVQAQIWIPAYYFAHNAPAPAVE